MMLTLLTVTIRQFLLLKETVSVILSDPPCKDNARKKLCLIKYELDIYVLVSFKTVYFLL